jgi:hypothetical protein
MRKRKIPRAAIGAAMMLTTAAVGTVVARALRWGWRTGLHAEPPTDPRHSRWRDLIIWTTITGLVGSFAKLFTRLGEERIARKIQD